MRFFCSVSPSRHFLIYKTVIHCHSYAEASFCQRTAPGSGACWPRGSSPTQRGAAYFTGCTQKSSPLRLLLIMQPWVQIFAWNFTWLSNHQIYTLSTSLVEIYRKMKKMCCFSEDSPPFSVCEHHAELTECEQVHWEDWVALKLSRFKPSGLSHLGHHAGKVSYTPAEA